MATVATPAQSKTSGVKYPPPLNFAVPFAMGYLLDRVAPMPLVGPDRRVASLIAGVVVAAAGIVLAMWASRTFHRARTPVNPFKPSTALVREGPFRFSRNPMYVGMSILQVGLAIVVNSFWPILFLPISLVVLYWTVIRREERYLSTLFGPAYDEYRRQVRRFL
jgi:protein-S-isoprenylcysteine O-methyltransferase Ste14